MSYIGGLVLFFFALFIMWRLEVGLELLFKYIVAKVRAWWYWLRPSHWSMS